MTDSEQHPTQQTPPHPRGLGYWLGYVVGFAVRWTLRLALLFLLLVLFAYFLIQVPAVQRYAAQQASKAVAKTLGVDVSVERIDIEPFTSIRLTDVFIGDRQGDTLLLTSSLRAQFFQPIRSLIDRTLYIEAVELDGARINIYRDSLAPAGNASFLSAYFSPEPGTTYVERDPFQLNLSEITIANAGISYRDAFAGMRGKGQLDYLAINLDLLDLPGKRIDGNSLILEGLDIAVQRFAPTAQAQVEATGVVGTRADTMRPLLGPFAIDFEELVLAGGRIRYVDERAETVQSAAFDPQHVAITDLEIGISNFDLNSDSLGFALDRFSFSERSGLTLYDLSAATVSFTAEELLLDELNLQTGNSRIGDRIRVQLPTATSWKQALDDGRIEVDLKPSSIQIGELLAFAPALNKVPFFSGRDAQKIQVRGELRGSLSNLRASDLELRLPDGSYLSADISTRNIRSPEEALLNVEVRELRTSIAKIRKLVPKANIPTDFDKFGEIEFNGRFDGFINDFVAYGDLRTDLGRATLDTRFVAKPGQLPRYTGEAALFAFDVGAYTGIEELGKVTAAFDIRQGIGLRPQDLRLDLIGSVSSIDFKGYNYRGIDLNGTLDPNGYVGAVSFADEHADLDFNGKISLAASDERFDFTATVRKLDLLPLKLSKEDWSFAGELEIQSNTLDLDNLRGQATVRSFVVNNPAGKSYTIDELSAQQVIAPDGGKRLSVNSPFALADLSGKYQLRTLPKVLQAAFAKTYPELYAQLKLPPAPARDSTNMSISFEAKLLAVDSLLEAFNVPASQLSGSQLAMTYDTETDNLDLSFSSAHPVVTGITLLNLGFDLRGQSGELDLSARAQQLDFGAYGFKDLQVYSEYADGDIRFSVAADTATSVLGEINFAGAIVLEDTAVTFTLDPSSHIDIGGERWTVEPGNELVVGKRRLIARDVQLTAGGRFIELETVGSRGLNVFLRQFNIDLLNAYLNPEKIQIAGEVDAFFTADDIYAREGISFSASIDTFTVNGVDWGALQTLIDLADEQSPLVTYTTFSRLGQQAILDATLAPKDGVIIDGEPRPAQYFDAKLQSEDFDMSFLSYFIPGITDLRGKLGANLHVFGTPKNMTPEGGILVDDCALTIDYLKTRYFIDSQYVTINDRLLDASGREIRDRFGNTATITGGLVHEKLLKWTLDVAINTNRLSVLNTDKNDNPLYYGSAFTAGRVAFSGPFNQTNIDIDAAALRGSRIVFPVNGSTTEGDLRFINFRQPEDSTRREVASFLRGINLDMDIDVRPAAELLIVFDEAAGDILRGQGTGSIQINVRRSGSYSMYGEYTVTEGDYLFTLLNVVNKPFNIQPGGTISWDGDPFTAQLDITAAYKGLAVAPITLIPEYTEVLSANNGALLELARQRTPVDLFLNLRGDLQRPDLSFDIELPDLQGQLRNYVNAKLTLIKADENLLNRQVFGLIVIGQFLPEINQLQASSVGFNTISELFSNQLSYLLTELFTSLAGSEGALSGIDIDITLQNNTSLAGANTVGSDLRTQLRTYFFDDRLEVGIGANFGQTVASAGQGQLTAGRFEVSYALTEDRRLRLKTFASRNVDFQDFNRNRAGVGLTWRRQFNSFAELFGAVDKAKRKEEEGPIIFRDASR